MSATVDIAELNPETRARVLAQIGDADEPLPNQLPSVELLEQVPEVEVRIVEEMTAKVFVPVREIVSTSQGAIRKVIEENRDLFVRARTMFTAQGRRVPVEGKPTWNKWLKQNLPCSDRYVRKVLADIGEEPKDSEPEPDDDSPLDDLFKVLSPFFGEGATCPLNVIPAALAWAKQNQQSLTAKQVETLLAVINLLGQMSKLTSKHHCEFEGVLRSMSGKVAA